MKSILLLLVSTLFFVSCKKQETNEKSEDAIATSELKPIIINTPLRFALTQRTTRPIIDFHEDLIITIGDITRGKVSVSLIEKQGKVVLSERYMQDSDFIEFEFHGFPYRLHLQRLDNQLAGEDTAYFQILSAPTKASQIHNVQSPDEEIDSLLSNLSELSDAKFVRNNSSYTVDEAIAHLTRKRKSARSPIKSAEDFIELVGSKSSMSDKPYIINLSDGRSISSREWFIEHLKLIRKNAEQGVPPNH